MKDWGRVFARTVKKAEKALGIEITGGIGIGNIAAIDTEIGAYFERAIGPPSKYEQQVKSFHETIYHARAEEKHRQQGGRCAHCGKFLGSLGECDHIKSRARGGRDDRMSNLQIVCPAGHGCTYHHDKHNKGRK